MNSLAGLSAADPISADTQVWRVNDVAELPLACWVGLTRLPADCSRTEKRRLVQILQARLVDDVTAECSRGTLAVSRSYADNYGICAVGGQPEQSEGSVVIGVDIEQDPGAARFPAEELRSVGEAVGLAASGPSPRRRFFQAWTEWEARGKALGTGITKPLNETQRLSQDHVVIDLAPLWRSELNRGQIAPLYGTLSVAVQRDLEPSTIGAAPVMRRGRRPALA